MVEQRPTPPLTEEELAALEGFIRRAGYSPDHWRGRHSSVFVTDLIADLRATRAELAALSWATREYDEDTGYCLCGCCRHGI